MQSLFKVISVAAMGIKALAAHANGAKYKSCLPKKDSIVSFIQKESVQPEPQKATSSKQCNITKGSSFESRIDLVFRCCSEQIFV